MKLQNINESHENPEHFSLGSHLMLVGYSRLPSFLSIVEMSWYCLLALQNQNGFQCYLMITKQVCKNYVHSITNYESNNSHIEVLWNWKYFGCDFLTIGVKKPISWKFRGQQLVLEHVFSLSWLTIMKSFKCFVLSQKEANILVSVENWIISMS